MSSRRVIGLNTPVVRLAVIAALLAGCRDSVAPNAMRSPSLAIGPAAIPDTLFGSARHVLTLDQKFERIAALSPAFGGLFEEADGTLGVYLTDTTAGPAVRPFLAALLRHYGVVDPEARLASLRIHRGVNDWGLLVSTYRRLTQALGGAGFGITQRDIDETQNRIVIGVIDQPAADRLARQLRSMGIESSVATVAVIPPTNVNSSLQGSVSPTVGGIQIESSAGICTYGFNVKVYNQYSKVVDPHGYFVTNSHCTGSGAAFGSVTGIVFGQPTLSTPIGYEVVDPPLFDASTDSRCRPGRLCRYSDAALVQLYDGVTTGFGQIAKVSGLDIVGNYQLRGIGTNLFAGITYTVAKVGRTSGYTQGTVTTAGRSTCLDVVEYENGVDTGRDMLCQEQATYDSRPGDSGSPIFQKETTYADSQPDDIDLVGINWGTGYSEYGNPSSPIRATYSSWGYIRNEIDAQMSFGSDLRAYPSQPGDPFP